MSEYRPFEVSIDGKDIELLPDNHGIALFRERPDNDYLDIRHMVGDEEAHTLVFRQRHLFLWMGNLALTQEDGQILKQMTETHGAFRDITGWNSKAFIEDTPTEFESEMLAQSLLTDLGDTLPESWE